MQKEQKLLSSRKLRLSQFSFPDRIKNKYNDTSIMTAWDLPLPEVGHFGTYNKAVVDRFIRGHRDFDLACKYADGCKSKKYTEAEYKMFGKYGLRCFEELASVEQFNMLEDYEQFVMVDMMIHTLKSKKPVVYTPEIFEMVTGRKVKMIEMCGLLFNLHHKEYYLENIYTRSSHKYGCVEYLEVDFIKTEDPAKYACCALLSSKTPVVFGELLSHLRQLSAFGKDDRFTHIFEQYVESK